MKRNLLIPISCSRVISVLLLIVTTAVVPGRSGPAGPTHDLVLPALTNAAANGDEVLDIATAAARFIPVSFTATGYVPTGEPTRQWVDEEGVVHIRGLPLDSPVIGDFTGTESVLFNQNIDPAGDGDVFGAAIFDVTWEGQSGTFEIRFSGDIEADTITADFTGRGTGDFNGRKLMGVAVENADGSFLHEGSSLFQAEDDRWPAKAAMVPSCRALRPSRNSAGRPVSSGPAGPAARKARLRNHEQPWTPFSIPSCGVDADRP